MNCRLSWGRAFRTRESWMVGLTLLLLSSAGAALSEELPEDFAAPIRPLLEEHCVRCHGGEETKGDVDLTGLRSEGELPEQHELWLSVIEQIDTEEMPPKGPFPSAEERVEMMDWLRRRIDAIDWSAYRDPGRVTLPRLTRSEYRNTLRDLLGVDLRAGPSLPEDGEGESGFTNDRDGLSMTPSQLEHYFTSGERAIEAVFALAKPVREWSFEAEAMERSPAKREAHEHGVVIVHPDHELRADSDFPVDGWYEFRIGAAVFGGKPCVAEVRIDGESIGSVRVTSEDFQTSPEVVVVGFVRMGRHTVTLQSRNLVPQTPEPPDIVRIIDERAKERAPQLSPLTTEESPAVHEAREGLNTKAWGIQESIEWLRFLGPEGDSRKIDLRRVYLKERQSDWNLIRNRLSEAAGVPVEEIDRRWRVENRERLADNAIVLSSVAEVKWEDWMEHQGKLFVDRLTIVGPVRPESEQPRGWNLVDEISRPDANPEQIIRDLLPRAFRRPVPEEEADRYVDLLREAQRREELREDALAIALTAVLASPRFLYREEAGSGPLDDFALASRLSYFLWQTMPDDELFDLADSELLRDSATLREQADRLLEDPRAAAFFTTFAEDWLGIRELGWGILPDPARFPGFEPALARSMKEESSRFLGWWFQEDRPISDLLESPVAFLDERLAEHYGIGGVVGEQFREVALNDQKHRGGLLGQGSVLVVTSSPARANPVRRGAWVLDRVLGEDPGEALPTAGELPGNAGEARGKTLREELDLHRTRAECARCHEKIDPLGFGLQNFDATGRWRDREAGRPVDASGVLPDGTSFAGLEDLKAWLASEAEPRVQRNVARRLLAFALGRELQFYDLPAVEGMLDQMEEEGATSRTLVRAILATDAFRVQGEEPSSSEQNKSPAVSGGASPP